MKGQIIDAKNVQKDIEDSADFVVVGTGAAGGPAAWVLTSMGYDVAIVEEGPYLKADDFKDDLISTFINIYRDAGSTSMMGKSMVAYIQGRMVGGSTPVNSAIVWRTPEEIVDKWQNEYGLGEVVNEKSLDWAFNKIEKDLNIHPIEDEILGENNRLFGEACNKMGYASRIIRRNAKGCYGSNRCMQGCPFAAKQSTDVTYIPWSVEKGARLYTNCKVTKITNNNKRADGIIGQFNLIYEKGFKKKKLTLKAKKGVVLAASVAGSAPLIMKSRLKGDSKAIGKYFMGHPGSAVVGEFDKNIDMAYGPAQGYESWHFRKSNGFKMETMGLVIELLSARVPGFGPQFIKRIENYNNFAVWDSYVRADTYGTVKSTPFGTVINYSLQANDIKKMIFALKTMSEMMFAVGAKTVYPGIFGFPEEIYSPDDLKKFDDIPPDPKLFTLVSTHMFGGARMGLDPKTSGVNTDFQVHGVPGLYVVDASVLPSNLGANPQHTVMGMAVIGAERIGENSK